MTLEARKTDGFVPAVSHFTREEIAWLDSMDRHLASFRPVRTLP